MAYVTAALYFCCLSCRPGRDVKRSALEVRDGEWLSVTLTETLPTTVLTGFLGSGKTTLLRRALVSPALADTAVIINELGAIAIDHHLVDFVEGSVLELPTRTIYSSNTQVGDELLISSPEEMETYWRTQQASAGLQRK